MSHKSRPNNRSSSNARLSQGGAEAVSASWSPVSNVVWVSATAPQSERLETSSNLQPPPDAPSGWPAPMSNPPPSRFAQATPTLYAPRPQRAINTDAFAYQLPQSSHYQWQPQPGAQGAAPYPLARPSSKESHRRWPSRSTAASTLPERRRNTPHPRAYQSQKAPHAQQPDILNSQVLRIRPSSAQAVITVPVPHGPGAPTIIVEPRSAPPAYPRAHGRVCYDFFCKKCDSTDVACEPAQLLLDMDYIHKVWPCGSFPGEITFNPTMLVPAGHTIVVHPPPNLISYQCRRRRCRYKWTRPAPTSRAGVYDLESARTKQIGREEIERERRAAGF